MLKISVIIPVYKVENYLRQCVDSVLEQTYQNIEVILVDDGSPDHCPQICDQYAADDSRVIVIHKENGGLSDARNYGVDIASGDYGIFVDSDDYWNDNKALFSLASRLEVTKAEVLSFPYLYDDECTGRKDIKVQADHDMPGQLISKEDQLDYLLKNGLYIACAWNKIVKMSLLKAIPFESGKTSEDIVWCAELLRQANSLDYLNHCFYCYRQRSDSITHSLDEKKCEYLRDSIIECGKIMKNSPAILQSYIGYYTAYQFSTFIAVQSFVEKFPVQCVRDLKMYSGILRYNQMSSKVRAMHYGTKIFGLINWCRIIRMTRPFWNSRRDILGK